MTDAIREVEDNVEATEAWNGPLFEIWIEYRDLVAEGLRDHGEAALAANPPHEGDRVLDIGCGLGDTTMRLAGLVGAAGHAHGVDVAERMIETAIEEAAEAGVENVSFATCDVETTSFDRTFDYAFSRMGTMFFANPVAALRNVREALAPGGLLNMVVWRRKLDNEFMHRAELVVAEYLEEPEESDVPRCGPGPFSMANADTVTDVLKHAGYEDDRARPPGSAVQDRQRPRPRGRLQHGARPRRRGAAHVGRAASTRSGRRSPPTCGLRSRTSSSTAAPSSPRPRPGP